MLYVLQSMEMVVKKLLVDDKYELKQICLLGVPM